MSGNRSIPIAPLRRRRLGLVLGGLCLIAGGCARESAWDWQASQDASRSGPRDAGLHAMAGSGSDPAVMVFPESDFRADERVADARRDFVLGGGGADPDVLPNRLAWPREARPDLRFADSFRTSRNANRFVFPRSTTGRRDGGWYWGYGYSERTRWGVRSGYGYGYRPPVPDAYPPYRGW